MLRAALAPALAIVVLSLVAVGALNVVAPQELAPLAVADAQMRQYAEAGHFPLMAAAAAAQRGALSTVAGLQTFGALALVFFASAHAAWRGFASSRVRGWSNAFWGVSVVSLCLAPSIFHGVSLATLDYLVSASASGKAVGLPGFLNEIYGPDGLNSRMQPAVFIIERAVAAGALAAFFSVLAHDIGYRLREAFEDFGLIEADEDRRRRAQAGAGASAGAGPHRRADGERHGPEEGGFGQRRRPPPTGAPMSEDACARAVLGVGANASRREIERAYRTQMKRAHPDHGGSVERAAALNAARDALLRRK